MKTQKHDDLLFDIEEAIFVARSRCGFTQDKLAKMVGTRQSGIARLENLKKLPSLTLVKRVADALDQNISFGFTPKDPNDIRFQKPQDMPATTDYSEALNARILADASVNLVEYPITTGRSLIWTSPFTSNNKILEKNIA